MALNNVTVKSSKKAVSNMNLVKTTTNTNISDLTFNVDYSMIDYNISNEESVDYNSNMNNFGLGRVIFASSFESLIVNRAKLDKNDSYRVASMNTLTTVAGVVLTSDDDDIELPNFWLQLLNYILDDLGVKDEPGKIKEVAKAILDNGGNYNSRMASNDSNAKDDINLGDIMSSSDRYLSRLNNPAYTANSTWHPYTIRSAVEYFENQGGFDGMKREISQKRGGKSIWDLAKNGERVNSIRGDANYSAGKKLKKNLTLYSKSAWDKDDMTSWFSSHMPNFYESCIADEALSSNSFTKLTKHGNEFDVENSTYFNHLKISDGKIEYNLVNKEGSASIVNKHSDNFSSSASISGTINVLHADVKANASMGYDHVTLEAAASVSLISADFKGHLGILELDIDGNKLELIGVGLKGNAQVLEADAKASVIGGVYKGDDKKLHVDAGVTLEANAELVSASITGDIVLLGIDGSVTAKVKIGVGAQFVVGIQDGELQFKIGIAVGVGLEIGANIDLSGLIDFLGGLLTG